MMKGELTIDGAPEERLGKARGGKVVESQK